MSTIIERCAALRGRIEELRRRKALQGQAEQLDRRRHELNTGRARLALAKSRNAVLVDRGHLESEAMPKAAQASASLAKVRTKLHEDPTGIASGRDYKQLLAGIDRIAGALEEGVASRWKAIVDAADVVDERLLARLAKIPGQASNVEHVRMLSAKMHALGALPPATIEKYKEFVAAAEALKTAWDALDHADIPPEVLLFFAAAKTVTGAPLALWTPTVRTWLDAAGMLDGVAVIYRGRR